MRNKPMTKQTPLNKQNIIILRWKTDISQLIWELKHSLLLTKQQKYTVTHNNIIRANYEPSI